MILLSREHRESKGHVDCRGPRESRDREVIRATKETVEILEIPEQKDQLVCQGQLDRRVTG